MSEELATLFEGKAIQVVEESGDVWFPLPDLTAAWGIDKNTLQHQIDRNEDIFFGMHGDKYVTYSTGAIQETCVNERGLYLLIGKLNAKRLKNPEAKAAIIRFQRWVPELIQKYRKKEIAQIPATPDIRTELVRAKEYAMVIGCDPKTLAAAVFLKHGEKEMADKMSESLQPSTQALTHGSTGWFIPTQLGQMCGLTAEQFNHWLHNNPNDPERRPFQCRDPENRKVWRLTELGFLHGQEYWFEAPSGHREIRIRWRLSILYASGLKREIPASQLMLPTRA